MTVGTGLVEQRQYNVRQQPTQIKVGTLMTLDFGYGTTQNNGIPASSGNVRTSTYDAENRQISVTDGVRTTTTYAYDGEGRRTKKTNQGVTTTFIYDAMGQLAAEYGGPGGVEVFEEQEQSFVKKTPLPLPAPA
jgi:YD repeat-containing protein